jgi:hypothetical protein
MAKTYKSNDYLIRLKPQAQDDFIRLEFDSNVSALRADNQSIIRLKASVTPNTAGEVRTVTFVAFLGAGQFKGTGATVIADQDGIARANLEVGGIVGEHFVAAEVKVGYRTYRTADLPFQLSAVPASEKIALTVDNPAPQADGFSLVHLTVRTKFTKDKVVILATNAGTFLQSPNSQSVTVALSQQGIAETDLRVSSEVKPHIISATITDTPPAIITISPTIAYPELLLVESSALKIEAGGAPVALRTFLRKQLPDRFVTKGIPVGFWAYQVIDNREIPAGRFNGLSTSFSSIDGSVPAVSFFADSIGIDKTKPIIIEVSAPKQGGGNIVEIVALSVN